MNETETKGTHLSFKEVKKLNNIHCNANTACNGCPLVDMKRIAKDFEKLMKSLKK